MARCKIIMSNGQEFEVDGTAEEIKKTHIDNCKNDLALVEGHYINTSQIIEIKDVFEHSMMPDIKGVSTKW